MICTQESEVQYSGTRVLAHSESQQDRIYRIGLCCGDHARVHTIISDLFMPHHAISVFQGLPPTLSHFQACSDPLPCLAPWTNSFFFFCCTNS
jgi:hypothetical protein